MCKEMNCLYIFQVINLTLCILGKIKIFLETGSYDYLQDQMHITKMIMDSNIMDRWMDSD